MSAVDNLKIVKEKIKDAANKVKRDESEIQLIAVSKTVSAEIIREVYDDGQLLFGESYVQEFLKKQDELPQINWHFIGQLQSNKVKYIVNKISMLHSLDRHSLAAELNRRYKAENLNIDALIQVNIGEEIQKGGIAHDDLFKFLDRVLELDAINPVGLMCIHPYDEPENCRKYFVKMHNLFQNAKDRGYKMKHLSMGMSGDYVQAIEEGATIVRVGSAIFGHRS